MAKLLTHAVRTARIKSPSFNDIVMEYDRNAGWDEGCFFDERSLEEKRRILQSKTPDTRGGVHVENWLKANYSRDFEKEE
jgi:hypothetical protein